MSWRAGAINDTAVLQQLRLWETQDLQAPERSRIVSDQVAVAARAGLHAQAVAAADKGVPLLPYARVNALESRAALAEAAGDTAAALRHYQDIVSIDAGNSNAARQQVFLTARLGSAGAALARARVSAKLFTPVELAGLRQAALGERLRWAVSQRDLRPEDPQRFAALDEVLRDGDALAMEFAQAGGADNAEESAKAEWARIRMRLDADRVVALFERGQWQAVLDLYSRMQATTPASPLPPYYATAAAAGAQARLRRPDLAVPLYQQALRDGGSDVRMPSDIHVGLVYALVDTARFEEADALLADMIARTPPLLSLSPEAGRPNDDYGNLLGLRARIALYTDRPTQAEKDAATLSALAPLNADYRTTQARVMRARQHPDAALLIFSNVLADHPGAIDARAGRAETLFDAGEYREARQEVDALQQAHPDHAAVNSAVRTRDTVLPARFEADASTARDGGTLSNRELKLETRLSSHWIEDRWRIMWRQQLSRTTIGPSEVNAWRSGIGVEWQQARWNLQAELHALGSEPRPQGIRLAAGFRASDSWRLGAFYNSSSDDLPARARLAGIAASDAGLSAAYIVDESRRFDAQARTTHYADGNERSSVGLSWRERWVSTPQLQLETVLAADAGRSDTQAVPYFSPSRDNTVSLGGRGQWLTWKRDDSVFLQVLEADAGRYNQAGFGSGPTRGLRYAHEWNSGNGRQLRYGLATSTHPYDGVSERRNELFLNLSVPLPQ